ncbi:enoyl-CoA hydratase [Salinibacillus xinjiangensis]|uniref:Enoyl-CoA hydratase n=1 Tax=Salinibacillus xinjiangensis TaxID=1229268 RepID=A0A6G1XBV4_9BACI|nr:enoyl-CoA hydratase [Salinibacillus xinjiangensis]MRG88386.1 enoyl-CoA hydratase [Salinibacillus xinjiangensis]
MDHLTFQVEEKVGLITFTSPPANALSTGLLVELSKVLDEVEETPQIKAIVIRGEGKFFSAGADIKEFTSLQDADDYTSLAERGQQLFNRMEKFHVPIIASIHGAALGGGLELAMSCHMRIVTKDAKLGLPELTLGIIPGFAGTQRLPRYVGLPKSYEMILTGKPISGVESKEWGLVNHAVSEEELEDFTMNLVNKIVDKSGPSVQAVMDLLPYAHTSQFQAGVSEEAKRFGNVFGTEDAKEGIQAFIEKRKPNFKDH